MTHSMTGFATAQIELYNNRGAAVPATLSIKTLNGRFLDIHCKLPPLFAHLEHTIAQWCKEAFKRGTISITLHIPHIASLVGLPIPSADLIALYIELFRSLQAEHALPGQITISDVMRMPQICTPSDETLPLELSQAILEHVKRLIEQVVQSRLQEGALLAQDLSQTILIIQHCTKELEPRAALISEERRTKFLDDIRLALTDASDQLRTQHIQALYQHINTIDTHEEIVRIYSHCTLFMETITNSEYSKGKRLDFILQELFREINTLGSKLADIISMPQILTIKTKLEQAREQVHNIV